MFKKNDIIVAKEGYLDKHETIKDTVGIVLNYNPETDYLEVGSLHPENYALPPIFCMRGECYRHITDEEMNEWGIKDTNVSELEQENLEM